MRPETQRVFNAVRRKCLVESDIYCDEKRPAWLVAEADDEVESSLDAWLAERMKSPEFVEAVKSVMFGVVVEDVASRNRLRVSSED